MTSAAIVTPAAVEISIHIPRVGDDEVKEHVMVTPSGISIHIPRVGDDQCEGVFRKPCRLISIHIPRVGDDSCLFFEIVLTKAFQSTSPVWGMTGETRGIMYVTKISIHIPRVGDDLLHLSQYGFRSNFNPHPPCGG